MALFLRQTEDRSKLQERLAAELQERATKKQQLDDDKIADKIEDQSYLKGTKGASKFSWLWILLAVIVIIALSVYIAVSLQR